MDKETKRLKHNETMRKYYHTEKGKKKILEAQKRWRERHREQFNEYQKKYQSQEKYKEKRRAYMTKYRERRKVAKTN